MPTFSSTEFLHFCFLPCSPLHRVAYALFWVSCIKIKLKNSFSIVLCFLRLLCSVDRFDRFVLVGYRVDDVIGIDRMDCEYCNWKLWVFLWVFFCCLFSFYSILYLFIDDFSVKKTWHSSKRSANTKLATANLSPVTLVYRLFGMFRLYTIAGVLQILINMNLLWYIICGILGAL